MAPKTIQQKTNREVSVMHTFKDSTLTQSLTTPGDTTKATHTGLRSESSHKDTKSFRQSTLQFFRNKSNGGVRYIEAERAADSFFLSVSYYFVQESAIQFLWKQCVDSRKFWVLGPVFNLTVMGVFLYTDKAVGSKRLRDHFYKSLLEQRASYPLVSHNCPHSSFTPRDVCIWFSRHRDPSIPAAGQKNTLFPKKFLGAINHCRYVYTTFLFSLMTK